jgi:hypothetical protein
MENDLQSQYVARSVAHEWITNAGREHIRLEGTGRSVSEIVKAIRRFIVSH